MTKINLTIEAETTEELKKAIADLNKTYVKDNVIEVTVDTKDIAEAMEEVKEEKPKKAKKDKATPTKEEVSEPVEETEPVVEKSGTANLYPDATKKDVQETMKKAMAEKHRDAVKLAFQRNNATKLSELAEEDYGVFLTDLEALIAGEK